MRDIRIIGTIEGNRVIVREREFHHLVNVLRKKRGDRFVLVDKKGGQFVAEITEVYSHKKLLFARVLKMLDNYRGNKKGGIIVFSLIRENRLRFLIEKCTEIGVRGFQPILTERSVNKRENVRTGWQAVVESAVKQSGRNSIPFINNVIKLNNALSMFADSHTIVLGDGEIKSDVPDSIENWALFIGPEGGFSSAEKEKILSKGAHIINLGENTLRSETAAIIGAYELNKIANKRR